MTDITEIPEEIRRRIKSENTFYYSVLKLIMQCNIRPKTMKTEVFKKKILLLFYGYETWKSINYKG